MTKIVLDASALLALLNDEPGADLVLSHLPHALLSTVNLAEVVSVLEGGGMASSQARAIILDLGLTIVPFDEETAFATGTLRPQTKPLGLSLGDRACLALAKMEGVAVVTTDRVWAELGEGFEVVLAR